MQRHDLRNTFTKKYQINNKLLNMLKAKRIFVSARLLNSRDKKCQVGLVREGEGRGMETVWLH